MSAHAAAPPPRSTLSRWLAGASLAAAAALAGCQEAPPSEGMPDAAVDQALDPAACEAVVRPLPIPFVHTLEEDHIGVMTEGGPLAVFVGPWGAHVQPHTGHPEGNVKADWYGLFTPTRTSPGLVQVGWDELGTVTEGGCVAGARCGVSVADVEARIPWYTFAEDAVRVVRAEVLTRAGDDPYNQEAWELTVELCPYQYTLGHVGRLSDELADAMVLAGAADPRLAPPLGVNLVEGLSVTAPAGMPLARPHIKTRAIPENGAYYTGVDSVPDVPWAQIEWTATDMSTSADGWARSEYSLMATEVREALAAILYAQAKVDQSFRYGPVPEWLWRAEHVLDATNSFERDASTSLLSGVGGWFQRPLSGECDPAPYATPECAETFSIFPIHTEGAFYSADLYSSADVRYLVYRGRAAGDETNFMAFGEVLSPAVPDPESGVLFVKWRHAYSVDYQAISYRFDAESGITRFHYGPLTPADEVIDPLSILATTVPTGDEPCSATGTVCMTQASYGRF